MTRKMKKDLIDIFNHFGKEEQIHYLKSECHEYIETVDNWYIKGTPEEKEDAIIDETADLFILSYQLYLTDPKVRERVNFKIERTKKRIEEGYYE